MVHALRRRVLFGLFALSAAASAAQAAQMYRLTVIGLAPKEGRVWSAYINDAGQVAGSLRLKADPKVIHERAYRWTEAGGLVIGDNGDPKATASTIGLDARGRLAINYRKPGWRFRIAAWNGREGAKVIDFGTAAAVNSLGDIVGFADNKPMMWMTDGRVVPITAGFVDSGSPISVNASGVVVGMLSNGERVLPTMWTEAGGTQPLPPPPGPPEADIRAWGINDAGEVVGTLGVTFNYVAYRWNADTGYEILPGVEKCAEHGALASNSGGTVVGWCSLYDPAELPHGGAWLWTTADGTRLIHDAIDPSDTRRDKMIFEGTSGVNSAGVIVGTGYYKKWHVAFTLTPIVPETAR